MWDCGWYKIIIGRNNDQGKCFSAISFVNQKCTCSYFPVYSIRHDSTACKSLNCWTLYRWVLNGRLGNRLALHCHSASTKQRTCIPTWGLHAWDAYAWHAPGNPNPQASILICASADVTLIMQLVGDKYWPSQSASSVPITCSDVVDQLLQHTTCKSIHPFELVSSSTLLITSATA